VFLKKGSKASGNSRLVACSIFLKKGTQAQFPSALEINSSDDHHRGKAKG